MTVVRTSDTVVALQWPEQARQAAESLDADRRRRREQAGPSLPALPPPLGASYRKGNVFILPDEDECSAAEPAIGSDAEEKED